MIIFPEPWFGNIHILKLPTYFGEIDGITGRAYFNYAEMVQQDSPDSSDCPEYWTRVIIPPY